MTHAFLHDRSVVSIAGDDRIAFLQGLITNDATLLEHSHALYAALLSPQGKFLHDFFLIPQAERILLDVNAGRAADLLARFNLYKLRAKVNIQPLPSYKVLAVWDAAAPAEAIPDPRLAALGVRIYGENLAAPGEAGDYEAHRIALGIPDGAKDMHIDKTLLLEFHFESLHGVSFSKGCYVGQEVTARSKFRGQVRKQLYSVAADTPLPAPGTIITAGAEEVGELRSVSGTRGLAVMKADILRNNDAAPVAAGITLQYRLPEWVSAPTE